MRVAVVGTCASGKTSVVGALRERGFEAYAVAQEHSAIPTLWAHLAPDRVVYLDTRLDTVRKRRGSENWPEWIYEIQRERLVDARAHADLIIATDDLGIDAIASHVVAALSEPE